MGSNNPKIFNIIYADPPWEYYLQLGRGIASNHYPCMSLDEICKFSFPCARNAILFLWATNPKLEEAFEIIRTWGFEYKTNIVWVKDKIGTGYYVRGKHELLLIGRKGNMQVPKPSNRPPSVIDSRRTQHSRKPNVIYEIIESMYPRNNYLELFGRTPREGWVCWGNQVAKLQHRFFWPSND